MKHSFDKIVAGYQQFRKKYATGDDHVMQTLALHGQKPDVMIVACCDSRVDPSLILQCHPGDLFVVRNVANIVPPYECDERHHGTSAAIEFGVCYLQVKHFIILGHSHCGGIEALLNRHTQQKNDFISNWVSQITLSYNQKDADTVAKNALMQSYQNCFTFPWMQECVSQKLLHIHRWFFDIQRGEISAYDAEKKTFCLLRG